MSKNTKKLVLLDAHAIIHRAYHAIPDSFSSGGEPTGALYGLSSMLMRIITDLKPDYVIACYDLPQKTFRHEAYDQYKAGRAKTDEALVTQLKKSREIFDSFNIPIYDAPGFEADDILGTIVQKVLFPEVGLRGENTPPSGHPSIRGELKNYPSAKGWQASKLDGVVPPRDPISWEDLNIIIASGDMDTMQLVSGKKVQVYTLKKGITDTILYDEDAVIARFGFGPKFLPDYKGLRGDPSDNIIGIKGIGEKTATNLILNFGSIEEIYKKIKKDPEDFIKIAKITPRIFELIRDNEEEAEFSKTLATIRTDAPINFVLPEKTFQENFDYQKVEEIFTKFEFRSLMGRLQSFFQKNSLSPLSPEIRSRGTTQIQTPPPSPLHEGEGEKNKRSVPRGSTSGEDFQETAIALWLINSDLTNPKLEDILLFSKKKSLPEAQEYIFEKLTTSLTPPNTLFDKSDLPSTDKSDFPKIDFSKISPQNNLQKVFEEIEKPIIPIIKKMEETGILIDQKYFENLSKEYHKELEKITKKNFSNNWIFFFKFFQNFHS
ncbi:MAG: 5'-3' exonuclease H3TH domain-containing protein, partial [Patescibacteria group bacterium]